MTGRKLAKLIKTLDSLRRAACKAREIEKLASSLGRKLESRGKEPMWMSQAFDLPPLSIPHHGGRDLPTGTRNSILDQLEEDVFAWQDHLDEAWR